MQTNREKKKMKSLKVFVPVCVSRCVCVYVCQHEYFRGPTLSGGDRASPERGHTGLQGGDWMGWTEREKEREMKTERREQRREGVQN